MTSAVEAVATAFDRIADDGRPGIWIALADRDDALRRAAEVDAAVRRGVTLRIAGSTLAVKDNIDVAGLPTTAACPAYAYQPAGDAPCVAALTAAGAVVVGKTNLDQFATGLVGTRSPYGICPNARWERLVSGGSSSGSAVAVAAGMVDLALGTDTAGSGRVPAACNGIVGVKPTRGLISTLGVVPACRSIDCVSMFAADVEHAAMAIRLASVGDAGSGPGPARPPGSLRLGVPTAGTLSFDGDADGRERWLGAVASVAAAAAGVVDVDPEPFLAAGALLYEGSFVAERYEAVGRFVDSHSDDVDPVVGAVISAAGRLPAWRVFRDRAELERLAALTARTWDAVDVLVVPTVPRVPTVSEVLDEPFAVNTMLGTYTNFVNLLDLCAVTVPVGPGTATAPPPSVTLIAPARRDEDLVSLASLVGTPASLRGA